jgi:hypothetical protein
MPADVRRHDLGRDQDPPGVTKGCRKPVTKPLDRLGTLEVGQVERNGVVDQHHGLRPWNLAEAGKDLRL